MAVKTLADLTLNITANSAELSKGLEKANASIDKSGKVASGFGKIMDETFKKAAGAIDSVIPGFSKFVGGLTLASNATAGLSGKLKVLKVALASTGIGLIVVALGSLVALFTQSDRGADKLSEKLAGLKAILQVVVSRLVLFGEGMMAFLKGDFRGGVSKIKEAFSDLGDEIKRAYTEGEKLKKSLNDLADTEAEFILTEAELSNKLKLAREVVNDENATFAQKQKAINTAAAAELDLYMKQKAILYEKYRIEKQQNDILRRNGEDNEDMLARENTILAEIEDINGERAMAMSRLGKMQERITKEAQKEREEKEKVLFAQQKLQNSGLGTFKVDSPSIPAFAPNVDSTTLVEMTNTTVTASDAIRKLFENVESFNAITDPFGFLVKSLDTLTGKLSEGAKSFKEYGRNILTTIKDIISGYLAEAVAAMISNALKNSSKLGPLALIAAPVLAAAAAGAVKTAFNTLIPGFATGTNYAPGGLSLVGERGPELVNLPRGAQVYNNRITSGIIGGEVVFRIEGTELVGILNKQNKINGTF